MKLNAQVQEMFKQRPCLSASSLVFLMRDDLSTMQEVSTDPNLSPDARRAYAQWSQQLETALSIVCLYAPEMEH